MKNFILIYVLTCFLPLGLLSQTVDVYVYDADEEWFKNDNIISISNETVKSIQIDKEDIVICEEKLGSAKKDCFILLNLKEEFGKRHKIEWVEFNEKEDDLEILLYEINQDLLSLYIVIYDQKTEEIREKKTIGEYKVLNDRKWPKEHYIATIESPDKLSKLVVITSRKLKGFRSNYYYSSYLVLLDSNYNSINTNTVEDYFTPSFALNNNGEVYITRLKDWDDTFTVDKVFKNGTIQNRSLEDLDGSSGEHSLSVLNNVMYDSYYSFNKKDNYFVVVEITEDKLDTIRHCIPKKLDKMRRNSNYFKQLYSVESNGTIYFSNCISQTSATSGISITIKNGYAFWALKDGELKLMDYGKYAPPYKKSRISYMFDMNEAMLQMIYLTDTEGETMLLDNIGIAFYKGLKKIPPKLNFKNQDISKTSILSIDSVHITESKDMIVIKALMPQGEKKYIILDVNFQD